MSVIITVNTMPKPNGSTFGQHTLVTTMPAVPKCRVDLQPDGGIQVHFLIEPDIAKRLLTRANGMSLEKWLWENVLYRSVVDAVY